tara:strand:- start:3394 stop:3759 length:366 start_codon:yes stop_codon:yes gene_type:complete
MNRNFVLIINNKVENTIVIDKDSIEESLLFLNTYFLDPNGVWKYVDLTQLKNENAAVNSNYNVDEDYYYQDKPMNSWIFNKIKYRWEPPIPYPDGEWIPVGSASSQKYMWDENLLNWISKT